jgi:hypothetical protein
VVGANLIGDSTSSGSNSAADQRALAASHQPANNGATSGRAHYNLRASMVAVIACPLGLDGVPVTALRCSLLCVRSQRKRKDGGKSQ